MISDKKTRAGLYERAAEIRGAGVIPSAQRWAELAGGETSAVGYSSRGRVEAADKNAREEGGSTYQRGGPGALAVTINAARKWLDVIDEVRVEHDREAAAIRENHRLSPDGKAEELRDLADRYGRKAEAKGSDRWETAQRVIEEREAKLLKALVPTTPKPPTEAQLMAHSAKVSQLVALAGGDVERLAEIAEIAVRDGLAAAPDLVELVAVSWPDDLMLQQFQARVGGPLDERQRNELLDPANIEKLDAATELAMLGRFRDTLEMVRQNVSEDSDPVRVSVARNRIDQLADYSVDDAPTNVIGGAADGGSGSVPAAA